MESTILVDIQGDSRLMFSTNGSGVQVCMNGFCCCCWALCIYVYVCIFACTQTHVCMCFFMCAYMYICDILD